MKLNLLKQEVERTFSRQLKEVPYTKKSCEFFQSYEKRL